MYTRLQGYCHWLLKDKNGKITFSKQPVPNLIVNNGLDEIGKRPIPNCFTHVYVGQGNGESFFSQTNLEDEVGISASYFQENGANEKIIGQDNVLFKRTFVIEGASQNYSLNEVGFSYGSGTPLFSRVKLATGINWSPQSQLLIQYELRVFMDPATPLVVENPISGLNLTGKLQFQFDGLAGINSDGTTNLNSSIVDNANEPSQNAYGFLSADSSPVATFGNAVDRSASISYSGLMTKSNYINGNFYRDKIFSVPSVEANQTWSSFGVGGSTDPEKYTSLIFVGDSAFEKTGFFNLTFRYSWGRYPPADSYLAYQTLFYNQPPESLENLVQNPLLTFFNLTN